MNESIDIDIEIVRAEALRKLGRNIVNFSKIEAGLKYLLSISKFEGADETISEQLQGNQAKLHKRTLGQLVGEFHKDVVVDGSQVETITDSSNSKFSFYFKIAYNPDSLEFQKRALSDVVAERNKLIHHDLALLDTTCVEDYLKLIDYLDEQNPRLLAHLDELGWIIESMAKGCKIFEEWLKSPEFLQHIQSIQADT